jgi:hypothetical protein
MMAFVFEILKYFFVQAMQCTERVSEEMERGRKKLQQDFSSAGLAEVQMKCKLCSEKSRTEIFF